MPSRFYDWYINGWRRLGDWIPGTNVFDKEWDVLVLLDCARPEMVAEVSDDYPYISSEETLQSVASCSSEWLRKTFREDYIGQLAETAYITANPNTADIDSIDLIADLIEVWRTDWNEKEETVPPSRVTDTAIQYGREETWDRLIVHYMQPHPPFLTDAQESHGKVVHPDRNTDTLTFPEALLAGEITPEIGWELHVENLRVVLDEVNVLRQNLDATQMVISSDHGQAFGEWRIYGHPCRVPIKALRTVPWETTVATDDRTYSPDTTLNRGSDSGTSLEEKLRALGYRE